MPGIKADDIAIFKRKKRFRRGESEKPLIERVRELEQRVRELERAIRIGR